MTEIYAICARSVYMSFQSRIRDGISSLGTRLYPFLDWLGISDYLISVYEQVFYRITPAYRTVEIGETSVRYWTNTIEEAKKVYHGFNSERDEVAIFLEDLQPDDVVWDVGAHIGLWSCAAGKQIGDQGEVFAFEPLPPNAKRIADNAELNDIHINVHEIALADTDGNTTLYTNSGELGDSRSSLIVEQSSGLSVQMHRGTSIDAPPPDVLKIDVEGAEFDVINGLKPYLDGCRVIYCEIHPNLLPSGQTENRLLTCLLEAGFTIELLSQRVVTDTYMIRGVNEPKNIKTRRACSLNSIIRTQHYV